MSSGEAWALVRERGKVLHLALLLSLCSVARCYELKMDDKRPDRAQDDDESGPARLDGAEGGSALSAAMYSSRIILLSSGGFSCASSARARSTPSRNSSGAVPFPAHIEANEVAASMISSS